MQAVDYGFIGEMHTAALMGKNGSIGWFCYPAFDSPSGPGADMNLRRKSCRPCATNSVAIWRSPRKRREAKDDDSKV